MQPARSLLVLLMAAACAFGAPTPAAQPPAPALAGAADAPYLLPPAWPARALIVGHPGARGVIRPVDAPTGLVGFQPSQLRGPSADDLADAEAVGAGPFNPAGAGMPAVEFERSGSFLFGPARQRADARPSRRPVAGVHFKFVSARTWQSRQEPEVRTLVLSRTWFALYEPTRAGDPAGVALVMPGLFNTPEPVIEHLIEQFRKRGWAVLRMMAQPSRFTERTTIRIDPQNLESAAERAAAEMQDRVAECAYAAQAAFQHLGAEKPALAKLPCIAVGMSGGAMTLPSVVALEPQRYAAAVLIAGGADFVTIALESNYRFMVDSIRFDWPEPPTDDQQKALAALYLQRAPLDSFHTAAALKGKPVLMIHGTHDAAVPAHLGDLLWERLGRPERWSEEAGHEEVFMRLPKKAGDILDWLDKAIRRE